MKNFTARMSFDRSFGSLELGIVTPEKGDSYAALHLVNTAGMTLCEVAIRGEELVRLRSGLTECEHVLLGHPRHRGGGGL